MSSEQESFESLPEVGGRWPGSCFACSVDHPHGLHLRFRHTAEGVVSSCVVPEHYCGFDGMVHGGIITTLLDEASAWALMARHGKLGVTREMTVRFLKPVLTGQELTIEACIVEFDSKTAAVKGTVKNSEGEILAESSCSWAFPRLSRIAGLAGVEEQRLQAFLDDCRLPGDGGK
ncbi:acyl-CoA thioesterase [Geotalea daltonii FRC-32]|uniref:Acyl-CoA thioesterase n=1 Tax=Geotalea daltonii (strain DSM 22248 / JCM 15807 / FRC-32) TaxID=316067 RepID=B9M3B6_GEODF|nr:PaaI family thioesterase [Geotalea daltonii]ACM19526.1 acyl-CoA thioesterase [Geotalea daltonii FRC-32]